MRFYNREKELENLRKIELLSQQSSKMTFIVGRRRIGKTRLIQQAYNNQNRDESRSRDNVYLFVAKKNEVLLCDDFVTIIQDSLGVEIFGRFTRFSDLFSYLMDLARTRPFTLVIDEFQEFLSINAGLYSDMQNIWDSCKDDTKMNLVLSGSTYSLMKKIFEGRKEPLFGRASNRIHLNSFAVDTLKEIMREYYPEFTNDDLLAFFILTGGVAKYVKIFVDRGAFTLEAQLDLVFAEHSLFLEEGKNLLIEEFGKEYTTYFSILSLIASSKTSRSEIESILEKNIGGYLDRLENEYTIIRKIKPVAAKEGSRVVKYEIIDNFFNFWFRFIFKYRSAIEIENYTYVKNIVQRDYATYSGYFLEKFFVEKLKQSCEYSSIGTYWERGNQNEIDIVAVNDAKKTVLIAEVKRDPRKIDLSKLQNKAEKLIAKYKRYDIHFTGYSLEDM